MTSSPVPPNDVVPRASVEPVAVTGIVGVTIISHDGVVAVATIDSVVSLVSAEEVVAFATIDQVIAPGVLLQARIAPMDAVVSPPP